MKKIITIFLIAFTAQIFAQEEVNFNTTLISANIQEKTESDLKSIIYSNENSIFFISRYFEGNGVVKYTCVKTDVNTGNNEYLTDLKVKSTEDIIDHFGFKFKNQVFFFISKKSDSGEMHELLITTYNLESEMVEIEQKKICEFSASEGKFSNWGDFGFEISPSGDNFVILGFHPSPNHLYPNSTNKIEIWEYQESLFDFNHSVIKLESEGGYDIKKFTYTDNNQVCLLGKVANKTLYNQSLRELHLFTWKNEILEEQVLDKRENYHYTDLHIRSIDQSILVLGKYRVDNQRESGLVSFLIHPKNDIKSFYNSFFESEALSELVANWKKFEYRVWDSEMSHVGGNTILILQRKIPISEGYMPRNLLITCFDSKGELVWQKFIEPKNRWFQSLIRGETGYLFFDDRSTFFDEDFKKKTILRCISYNIITGDYTDHVISEKPVKLINYSDYLISELGEIYSLIESEVQEDRVRKSWDLLQIQIDE